MKVLLFVFLCFAEAATAQLAYNSFSAKNVTTTYHANSETRSPLFARKLFQRNTGMIIGLQKGNSTSIELGAEAHWRKLSFRKPHVIGATTNMEYNFGDNILGYKAGMWMKRGRVNLTYGANVSYFTNFKEGHRFGIGPSVGFRVVGLHLINGYNILTKDKTNPEEVPIEVNSLYMSLRYYFPVTNSFTWDRKTMKKKKERRKEKERKVKEREERKESGESKGILDIFKPKPKETEKKKESEEGRGILEIFKPKPKETEKKKESPQKEGILHLFRKKQQAQ